MEDYTPRSPDLSGLNTQSTSQHQYQYAYPPPPSRGDSFSLGTSSYYQPPPLPHGQSSTAFSQPSYEPPFPKLESQSSWQTDPTSAPQARRPGRPKRENTSQDEWPEGVTSQPKARKPSMKSQRPSPPEPEPRPPAPGDAEGIVVKTKFPVARIKRIVQADEEVGKVAQAAPVAMGKALELFMIQMTLSAINDANNRGTKRLIASHIKTAIFQDDKFDFLENIGKNLPDGPPARGEGREKKAKAERGTSEEDVDMDADFAGGSKMGRKRRRRKPVGDD